MQADRDEIDQIVDVALDESLDPDGFAIADVTAAIRGALKAAGYTIVLDEAQLLEKGEKLFKPVLSGVEPRYDFPMAGQALPATMESTLDLSNPNRHQLWPIDGGKK